MGRSGRAQLAIVGASAAGLAGAIAAARAGADVVLYDGRAAIGEPPAPAIVGFDFLWPAQLPAPSSTIRRRLEGLALRGPAGRGPVIDAPLSLFDRHALDGHLAREAQKAGARIELAAEVDADKIRETADLVLFADGARSQAARYIAPQQDPANLAWGAILELAPGAQRDADQLLLTLGSHAPGGRSQLNPLGNGRWSHWTFFRGDVERAEPIARRALALDARLEGWGDVDARFVGVAPDPVYTIPGQLVGERLLVAGGAAGQGGLEVGLASGWMAGETAARVLQGRGELRDYEKAWRARYRSGYARLRRASDRLALLTDRELDRLLRAWDGVRLTPEAGARTILAHPRGALALGFAAWLASARG